VEAVAAVFVSPQGMDLRRRERERKNVDAKRRPEGSRQQRENKLGMAGLHGRGGPNGWPPQAP